MNVYVVTSKLTGHVMGVYSNYSRAREVWDISRFTIDPWTVT